VKSLGRKIGIVGLVLGWGVACTQLFGDERQNTLAPVARPNLPGTALPQPGQPGVIAVCDAGVVRCEGALLQVCADDGSSWVTTQRCAAAALCQANPATCLAATCSTEEMTCSGSVLQKCNAERTGWDLFATCLSPAHCNAGQRQCLPEPCTPGERRCDRSETDQSPVLEVCRDDRQDWGALDACVTRELCDQTLTSGGAAAPVPSPEGMVQVQLPGTPAAVVSCLAPACAVGEVRCEGARLEFCSEGRTGWNVAEECASAALCEASRASAGLTGTPQCLPPVCGVGQHQCTATGVLQVCSDDRTGFVDQEACIGPPFCNAVLADQGEAGCRDAPCEAGVMQCNGAQIQVCRDDRTALDDTGAPCESAALCNADDPTNAFCDDPVCRRGATSGNEFRCDGAQLQRCNESLTVYDTLQTCVTPELCDASQRANGCKTPACQPGQHACSGGFLQTCNAGQTAFENTENCGSQAQCDANAGRCADPCEIGSQRCNATTGDLEQCNDLLTGWQPIADCPNVQLCDLQNGRCDICFGGQFSCADNQLRQCAADGGTFSRQNIPPECAPLPNNAGVGVRGCQNNAVVVTPCQFGCANGVCFQCQPNTSQCINGNQIRRCNADGTFGATTSCVDGNQCDGAETCNPQTNACTTAGTALNCNDGNRCTNDSCNTNPGGGCVFAAVANNQQCAANALLQRCVNGQPADVQCNAQLGCLANQCATCGQNTCENGQRRVCTNGQLGAGQNCAQGQVCQGAGNCVFNCAQLTCADGNPCTDDGCNAQQGCVFTNDNTNNCSDNNACTGNEVCQNGACSNPPNLTDGTGCGGTNICLGGQCRAPVCTPNVTTQCLNGVPQRCNATGTAFVNTQPTCDDDDDCTRDVCDAQNATCTHNPITTGACAPTPPPFCTANVTTRCTNGALEICNGSGTAFQQANPLSSSLGICNANNTQGTRCVGNTVTPFPCQSGEACLNGFCESTGAATCTVGEIRCTAGTPAICIAGGRAFQSPAFCVDGVRHGCQANGNPTAPQPCPDDGNECTIEDCATNTAPTCRSVQRNTGACTRTNGTAGECSVGQCIRRCSATNPCLGTETCQNGICQAAPR